MTWFEPQISCVRSNCSTNWSTTAAHKKTSRSLRHCHQDKGRRRYWLSSIQFWVWPGANQIILQIGLILTKQTIFGLIKSNEVRSKQRNSDRLIYSVVNIVVSYIQSGVLFNHSVWDKGYTYLQLRLGILL